MDITEEQREKDNQRNCELSLSLDVNDMEIEDFSDSETDGLEIDVSEIDGYGSTRGTKLQAVEDVSVFNEMEGEIERQLDAKASKRNLTATNVKNILKDFIKDQQMMAVVQRILNNINDDMQDEGMKLTRSKAK